MNQVDLHTHTTASDGVLSPASLVARAARLGLRTVAITDHDTTEGVREAQAVSSQLGLEVIAGVEINTDVPGAEVHVLGYFVDPVDPSFADELRRLREGRLGRARQMADALAGMGAPISLDRIREIAGKGAICRPHLARALVEAGHVNSYQEAFDRFIGRGSPAYVERTKLSPEGACLLIRAAGGIPVLAHPVFFDRYGAIRSSVELDGLLPRLVASGLGGLEVYYPGYDAVTIERLLHLARRYELAPTGGTDFHGARFGDADIGGCYVPAKVVRGLRAAWERQR